MAFNLMRCRVPIPSQVKSARLLIIRQYVADPSFISDFPGQGDNQPTKVKATRPPVSRKDKPENQRESTDKRSERPDTSRVSPDSRKIYPDPHQKRPGTDVNAKPWYEQNPIIPDLGSSSSPFEDIQKRKFSGLTDILFRTYSKKAPKHTLDEGIPGPADPLPPPIPNDPTTQYVVEPCHPPPDSPPEIPPSPYVPPKKMKIPVSGIPPPRDPPPASAPPEVTRPDDGDSSQRFSKDQTAPQ